MNAAVVVLDFGSQYTQLIARRVREIGVRSVLLPADATLEKIDAQEPAAVVLSGGPRSVTDATALRLPEGFFDWCRAKGVAVLGICYGLQILVTTLKGEVVKAAAGGEYGRVEMHVDLTSALFQGISRNPSLSLCGLKSAQGRRGSVRLSGCRMGIR